MAVCCARASAGQGGGELAAERVDGALKVGLGRHGVRHRLPFARLVRGSTRRNSVNAPGSVSTSMGAAMLFHDDVVAHRQPQPGAFAGWFCREEGIEHLLLHLGRDAGAVVADADFDMVVAPARRGDDQRLELRSSIVGLAFGYRIEAVGDQVEQDAGDFLRKHLDLTCLRIEVAPQRDVKLRLFSAGAVIGEVEALVDQRVDIGRAVLARSLARMQQHVFDDRVRALAVLHDFVKVGFQQAGYLVDFLADVPSSVAGFSES